MRYKVEQLSEAFLQLDMGDIAHVMNGLVCCGSCPALSYCNNHKKGKGKLEDSECQVMLEEWLETDDEPTYVEE